MSVAGHRNHEIDWWDRGHGPTSCRGQHIWCLRDLSNHRRLPRAVENALLTTGVITPVHDEGSRQWFITTVQPRLHDAGSPLRHVRAERAGWLGATSELRDGDSLKTASERVLRRRPGFVSSVRQTSLPNRLGADHLISQAGDAIVRTRRGEVVFPRSEAGAPSRPARSARTNGRQTGVHDVGSRRGFTTQVQD